MNFHDFSLRAWVAPEDTVNVLVHNSPVGNLRRPITAALDRTKLRQVHDAFFQKYRYDAKHAALIEDAGQWLCSLLLPSRIIELLTRSLERVDPDGIRMRLCLDETLIDLPWEFLKVDPAASASDGVFIADGDGPDLAGFIATNPRLSIVREAPMLNPRYEPTTAQQRLVFAGAMLGDDQWKVRPELTALRGEVANLADLLAVDACVPARRGGVFDALSRDAAIFHYSGHVAYVGDEAIMIGEMPSVSTQIDTLMADGDSFISANDLGAMLQRSHTRLAVFAACNSGYWPFAKPLLMQGLPAMIGFQGYMSVEGALVLSATLYKYLATGLSLDEAVNTVRRYLALPGTGFDFLWGALMVYLPTPDPVLLPRPSTAQVRALQDHVQEPPAQIHIDRYIAAQSYQEGDTFRVQLGDVGAGAQVAVGKQINQATGAVIGRESRAGANQTPS